MAAHLQDALGSACQMRYPMMPDPEKPAYTAWKEKLEQELNSLHGDIVLIGHSLGGSVLLKYLSEEAHPKTIAGLFLIAVPYWGTGDEWLVDEFTLQENFSAKLASIPHIFLYHSQDDEVVPFAYFLLYAKRLPRVTARGMDGYGHLFNAGLPELVHDLQTFVTS
ncbi:alpha/beta hydrolase [Brevibacillus humidisoli]|uniref:alpha/beta hydrolase n=1 Tax=Brevibacillus humidisoli TaxID=2895522 RepID=UPI001E5892BD|nr:alpha/beta hydrolase [Brevibacillus humidisoli]UFJ42737.1 alpha/beta hydrolase [Brevibacillus humidisoli]